MKNTAWGVWRWTYMGEFTTLKFEGPDAKKRAKAEAKRLKANGIGAVAAKWSEKEAIK